MSSRKLLKFLIMFDNSNLLFFPGQFLSGRVIVEVDDDMPVMGKSVKYIFTLELRTFYPITINEMARISPYTCDVPLSNVSHNIQR